MFLTRALRNVYTYVVNQHMPQALYSLPSTNSPHASLKQSPLWHISLLI